MPCSPPGDLPDPGIKPASSAAPALQADSLPSEPPGKPKNSGVGRLSLLQGIFLTQELSQGFLHCRQIFLPVELPGTLTVQHRASQVALVVKNPHAHAGDVRDRGLISGSGRSPGGGHGNPLQYSYLENPLDRGAGWATLHRVTKSRTQLQ